MKVGVNMSEKIAIVNFSSYELFNNEEFAFGNVGIRFYKANTVPHLKEHNDLCVVVCDFDDDDCIDRFLDISNLYSHIHLFILAEIERVRATVRSLIHIREVKSFSTIVKNDDITAEKVVGEVYNYITPLCSTMVSVSVNDYKQLIGPIESWVYEYESEEMLCEQIKKIRNDSHCAIAAISGSGFSMETANQIRKMFDNEDINWAMDTSKATRRVAVIRALSDDYKRSNTKSDKAVFKKTPDSFEDLEELIGQIKNEMKT